MIQIIRKYEKKKAAQAKALFLFIYFLILESQNTTIN